ncbi:hypothetical protein [Mesorhizobium sp. M1322]|uniref:hypothetical protein n=1 Tax=Mesorhizobium sp. M1322 TaxID=2957081 RepID=UPI003338564E
MNSILLRFILACLLLPCLWTTAGAQGVSFPDFGGAVPGHKHTTYLDLARMVILDLAADKDGFYRGSMPIEMRHIEGPDSGGPPPETSGFSDAGVLQIKAGGKDRLASSTSAAPPTAPKVLRYWRSTILPASRDCSTLSMSPSTGAPISAIRASCRSGLAMTPSSP